MAQQHVISAGENLVDTSDGTRRIMEESTTTTDSSKYFTAREELCSTSAKVSTGCAPFSSEYFSTRIQSLTQSRSELGTNLEAEIEASKEHWSTLQAGNGEEGSAEANLEVFRSLLKQWPNRSFWDWDREEWALGEKTAEGAQGEIFEMSFPDPETGYWNSTIGVLKVFKEGFSLQDLQKQWPPGHAAQDQHFRKW